MALTAHGTLAPDVVTTVTVDSGRGGIVVVNRQQSGAIWVRIDGVDPAVNGANSYIVLGAREFVAGQRNRQVVPIEVRMLSTAAVDYSVEAF